MRKLYNIMLNKQLHIRIKDKWPRQGIRCWTVSYSTTYSGYHNRITARNIFLIQKNYIIDPITRKISTTESLVLCHKYYMKSKLNPMV